MVFLSPRYAWMRAGCLPAAVAQPPCTYVTMVLCPTAWPPQGFEALLNLVNNTANDSFELYYGLFLYNQNATDELERLEQVGADRRAAKEPETETSGPARARLA